MQIFFEEHSRFNRDIFLNFIQRIKEKGDALDWSSEKRITPIFAALLFNLKFFSEVLILEDQESGSEPLFAFDKKENKRERKKQIKID